jgi:hypothetical protein
MQLRAFLPVARFSRAMLSAYVEELQAPEWRGHFEAVVPTVAANRGLLVEDLGGDGPFVPIGWRDRHYSTAFDWRPPVAESYFHEDRSQFLQSNLLHHPVKIDRALY